MIDATIDQDEIQQKVAWRGRLAEAIILRKFDNETLLEMLAAGFHRAHSEGLQDAAKICRRVADRTDQSSIVQQTASILLDAMIDLDRRNALTHEKSRL